MMLQRIAWSAVCALSVTWVAGTLMRTILRRAMARLHFAPAQKYRVLLLAFLALPVIAVVAFARLLIGVEVAADSGASLLQGPAVLVSPSTATIANIAGVIAIAVTAAVTFAAMLHMRRFALRMKAARDLARSGTPSNADLCRVVENVARRMGLRMPTTRTTAGVTVPSVAGIIRPVLLLPPGVQTLVTREQLQLVIAHELAHIARRDPLVNAAQAFIDALLFFSAPARALSAEIRADRELAADARAAAAFGTPLVLARALERLESMRAKRPARLALAADDEPLLRRIVALADTHAVRSPGIVCDVIITALVAAAAVANIAAIPATAVDNAMRLAVPAAAFRQDIKATDNAGPFTLQVVGYRAVGATIAGKPFPAARIRQRGDAVRFTSDNGATLFTVRLQPTGGMKWHTR